MPTRKCDAESLRFWQEELSAEDARCRIDIVQEYTRIISNT